MTIELKLKQNLVIYQYSWVTLQLDIPILSRRSILIYVKEVYQLMNIFEPGSQLSNSTDSDCHPGRSRKLNCHDTMSAVKLEVTMDKNSARIITESTWLQD